MRDVSPPRVDAGPGGAARRVAVALLLGVLAAGCSSAEHDHAGAGAKRPVVRPTSGRQVLADEAANVVRQYWRARSLAYSSMEPGPLTGFEDQAAFLLSRADIAYRQANGLPADPAWTSDLREMHNYLTRPDRFPRWLLAAVTTAPDDAEPEVYLLTFSKPSAQTPWKLVWQAMYADNTRLPSIRVDADGFASLLTPAQQRATLLADTAEIRRRLQDYRLRAAATTTPPRAGFFVDTRDTYGAARELQADVRHARQRGVQAHLIPLELGLPGYAFATRDGALVLVTLGEETVHEYRASPLQQDQYRINFDQRIPPGSYRTVVFRSLTTAAVEVPMAGSRSRAMVIGRSSSVASVTAKP